MRTRLDGSVEVLRVGNHAEYITTGGGFDRVDMLSKLSKLAKGGKDDEVLDVLLQHGVVYGQAWMEKALTFITR